MKPSITVLIDNDEKRPYAFASLAAATRVVSLDVGDYQVEGVPGFVVERKSKSDLWGTLGAGRDRFERMLARARAAGTRVAVVIEASILDLLVPPRHVPREGKRVTPTQILRTLQSWSHTYADVLAWHPVGPRDAAERWAYRLLEWAFIHHVRRVAARLEGSKTAGAVGGVA